MWRKFLGFGIPLVIVGGIMWIAALVKVGDYYYGGSSGGIAALLIIGEVIALVGISLTSAGLIGAAIRAEDITAAVDRGFAHLSKQLAAMTALQAVPEARRPAPARSTTTPPSTAAVTTATASTRVAPAVPDAAATTAAVEPVVEDLSTGECPQCGHPADPDDGFCGRCGRSLKV